MEHQVLEWRAQSGWSTPPPAWDGPGTLVLVMGNPVLAERPELLEQLRADYPSSVLMGASTCGQIHGDELRDISAVVAFARFERTRLHAETELIASPDQSREAAGRLGARLAQHGDDLSAVFVLSEGVSVDGAGLAAGLSESLPEGVLVSGGLAADEWRHQQTWVLDAGHPVRRAVSAVGLYGPHVRVRHGSRRGWLPLGPRRVVTGSDGDVLLTLDSTSALELVHTYLGDRVGQLPAAGLLFPMAVRTPEAPDREQIVVLLGTRDERGGIQLSQPVREGSSVQLMHASAPHIIEAAAEAGRDARLGEGGPGLAVAVSCVGRRVALGESIGDEVEAAFEALTPGTSLLGYYSYGELSATAPGRCELLSQTMTVTTFGET